jgi:HAD superfamily phosphoserine phosphatase-like hydrolase
VIAVFDFDGTLLPERNNLYWHLVRALPDRRWRVAKTAAFAQTLSGFIPLAASGVVDQYQMMKGLLLAVYAGLPIELVNEASERIVPIIEEMLYPEMREVLEQHRSDNCYMVSSNTQPIVGAFCRRYGIECLATRLHTAGNRYTGLIDGELTRAYEKLARLREAGIDPAHVTMYGNSMDDEALLLASGRPVLVNADSELLTQRRLKSAQRIAVTKHQAKGD